MISTEVSMPRIFPVFLLMSLSISTAFAQHQTFAVDPAKSDVAFTLSDVMHSVHGTFHVESGTIQFDRSSPEISGDIVVAAGSGKTGSDTRDHKMNSDVLNVSKFTEATFSPKHLNGSILATGDSTVQVDGVFTLHGTPHDLTVPMQIHIEGDVCTARTHFSIPYVKWGLKDPSNFLFKVGKEVDMDVTLAGKLSGPA